MDTDAVNEANQDTSEVVPRFEGMIITDNGLVSVRKHGHWLTDDIMAYLLRHAEFEYIKNNVDP